MIARGKCSNSRTLPSSLSADHCSTQPSNAPNGGSRALAAIVARLSRVIHVTSGVSRRLPNQPQGAKR